MKLRDVLPEEFHYEYSESKAAEYLDVEVVRENGRTVVIGNSIEDNPQWKEWPGKHTNVHVWWELANGKAVGWNENPGRGWSFPVIRYTHKGK